MQKKHYLITGGSGYFGSILVDKLLAMGHQCSVLDQNPPDAYEQQVRFIQGDVRDLAVVRQALEGVDTVHHNVAQVPLAKDKHLFESVNKQGTNNILQASLEADCNKVVYTSSSAVFGVPEHNPVTEETLPAPFESYGKAKYEGELLCHSYVQKGLDVSIVRPRTILGHGRLGIFQILFEWVLQGKNIPVLDNGKNIYQFVHADDLAQCCYLAGEQAGSQIYNCGTDRYGTMRETLQALCDHANTGTKIKSLPMKPLELAMKVTSRSGLSPLGPYHALMYGRSMYFDSHKAKKALGMTFHYSNIEMIIDSYEWYVTNRDHVLTVTHQSHHRSPLKAGILNMVQWII